MFEEFCAGPEALHIMGEAVEVYCSHSGLSSPIDRQVVARRVIWAYKDGFNDTVGILQVMATQDQGESGRPLE